ncbi:hypothetical protein K504DRAFT_197728 [Pleomassaria siparia CBS 279.74]|uniref:Uncharacterized protein n=1 Tax=Pleomassaria siparia CBS 279.74 TaxID=1314801 RepID=A0A6G1KHV7_9PLEO|nr:hypothetical protein K504DRAFT_197728 [Pleomassaria siparia CBS 279.74]
MNKRDCNVRAKLLCYLIRVTNHEFGFPKANIVGCHLIICVYAFELTALIFSLCTSSSSHHVCVRQAAKGICTVYSTQDGTRRLHLGRVFKTLRDPGPLIQVVETCKAFIWMEKSIDVMGMYMVVHMYSTYKKESHVPPTGNGEAGGLGGSMVTIYAGCKAAMSLELRTCLNLKLPSSMRLLPGREF